MADDAAQAPYKLKIYSCQYGPYDGDVPNCQLIKFVQRKKELSPVLSGLENIAEDFVYYYEFEITKAMQLNKYYDNQPLMPVKYITVEIYAEFVSKSDAIEFKLRWIDNQ